MFHGSGAMGKRIDELKGRLAAINDKLSGVVNQFNGDKQKFKDETEFEFAQTQACTTRSCRTQHEKSLKDFDKQLMDSMYKTANTMTNLQQRVVHLESNSSGAYNKKGYLLQKSMIPNNFTDKTDEWRSWPEEVADYVDTMTPGMKKVLAEIDQETDVIDDLWRHARETKYGKVTEEHTNLWRLLRKITEGESKKVVMCIKDEDGFRAWQRLKQRFEPGLAAGQGTVMAEFSGMVARRPRAPEKLLHC